MNLRLSILLSMIFFLKGSGAFAQAIEFPFYVYRDARSNENHGAPSGWMGDFRDIIIDLNCEDSPYSGDSCVRIIYTAEGSKFAYWAGMTWQYPANNTGYIDGGINLSGAKKLTFWVRGDKGGEIIDAFKFGGTLGAYPDTDSVGIYQIMLSHEWTQYEIDLADCDLSYISSLFCWVANRYSNPNGFVIYIDEIRIE